LLNIVFIVSCIQAVNATISLLKNFSFGVKEPGASQVSHEPLLRPVFEERS